MAHQKHHVDAIVLSSTPVCEADALVHLLTKEFGSTLAVAKSVREEKSKMRYALQPLSRSHVSLVRGRDIWRIVGASLTLPTHLNGQQVVLARIGDLLRRFNYAEEANNDLFNICDSFWNYSQTVGVEDLDTAEILTVARILKVLGYIAHEKYDESGVLSHIHYDRETMVKTNDQKEAIVSSINHALSESQL